MSDVKGKQNLFSRFYKGIVCELAKEADALSWVFVALFIATSIFGVLFATNIIQPVPDTSYQGSGHFYARYYWAFWYGGWVFLVLSTIGPLLAIRERAGETPLGMLVCVSILHLLTFVAIGILILRQQYSADPSAVTALLAALVTIGMVGIGWAVQYQGAARAARRAHTFNVLMQSRLSAEFQRNIRLRSERFSAHMAISADDAALCTNAGRDAALRNIDASNLEPDVSREQRNDVKAKHKSLKGVCYLLNFYEFIFAGVKSRDIDEELIELTISDIATTLYIDAIEVIAKAQQAQPNAFCELDAMMKKWRPIWSDKNRERFKDPRPQR